MRIPDGIMSHLHDMQKAVDVVKTAYMIAYAKANDPHKVGDILEDHYHIIRVENITYYASVKAQRVSVTYKGTQLTKKLEVHKKQPDPHMYDINVERKITK